MVEILESRGENTADFVLKIRWLYIYEKQQCVSDYDINSLLFKGIAILNFSIG